MARTADVHLILLCVFLTKAFIQQQNKNKKKAAFLAPHQHLREEGKPCLCCWWLQCDPSSQTGASGTTAIDPLTLL
jgi:hypothetical protein